MPDPVTPPPRPAVNILMYHQVGDFRRPASHKACFCDTGRFRSQMRFLARAGFRVIGLDRALAGLFHGEPLPRRPVVLTFDDGTQDFHDHALPVLREHGYPATVFPVSGLLGHRAEFVTYRPVPWLMSAETLRAVHGAGIQVGSHTVTHPRLSRLDPDSAGREIADSKAFLEDLLGAPVDHFCYPKGDYDVGVRDRVREAGYRSALTTVRGAANTAANPFEIPRKAVSFGDNLIGYAWKLHFKHAQKRRATAR
jgi:peptidoglycan/xylan/chitin deacetylase (PgdA/CDA1 family)